MSWIAVAIIGTGVLGAGGMYLASQEQSRASKAATGAELQMWQESQKQLAPWYEKGAWGLNRLQDMLYAGPGTFKPGETPGYRFGYKEFVEKPYLAGAGAKGKLFSGGTGKDLTRYAMDYGEMQYDRWLDRYYNKLTPYQSLAGLGMTTASQGAQNTLATGSNIANNLIGQGDARASMWTGIGNLGQNTMNNYMNYLAWQDIKNKLVV